MNTDKIIQQLDAARRAEAEATQARIALEEQVIEVLGVRDNGAQTHHVGEWSVTITAKTNRTIDWEQWETVKGSIPPHLHPVRTKQELDQAGLAWLERNDPRNWRLMCQCITSKPAKTSVTIKRKA